MVWYAIGLYFTGFVILAGLMLLVRRGLKRQQADEALQASQSPRDHEPPRRLPPSDDQPGDAER